MRLETIKTRGFGHVDLDIDLSQYGDAKLIAICGPNGAGKSTALELWAPGSFYRKCPTRGPLAGLALTRDAVLEVGVVNGQPWKIRHQVDGVNGKAEAVVLDGAGRPALADAKVRSFDSWASKHLPHPDVLFLTTFSSQGSGGFAALSRSERMAVIGRVVADVESLEAKAQEAKEHAREWQAKAAELEARLADETQRYGTGVSRVEAELAEARARAERAEAALADARRELDEARAAEAALAEARRAFDAWVAERAKRDGQRDDAQRREADLAARVANNRAVLERAAEIRTAVADLEVARQRVRLAEHDEAQARAALSALEGEVAVLTERHASAVAAQLQAVRRVEAAQRRLVDAGAVRSAAAGLPALRAALKSQEEAVTAREEALAAIRGEQVTGAESRILGLREGLVTIANGPPGREVLVADATIEADDAAAAQAAGHPVRLAEAQEALRCARGEWNGLRLDLAAAEALGARLADVTAAEAEAEEGRAALRAGQAGVEEAARALAECRAGLEPAYAAVRTAEAAARVARDAVAALEPLAAKAGPLAGAEARLAELEPQLAAVRAELAGIDSSARPAPAHPTPAPDVAAAARKVEDADLERVSAHQIVATWEQRLADASASSARIDTLQAELDAARAEVEDWTRLADDLGKQGLQALEIDAGGPELGAIASDLLHHAYGSRWTVSLDTTRQSSDGKRTLEDCEITVIDTVRGREGPLESFSGGERVVLGEAVSLALTTIACRNAGVERPTIVRDESGAALDEAAGRAYVAMLRRAADLIQADRVLVVTHSTSMQELCDAQIQIGAQT